MVLDEDTNYHGKLPQTLLFANHAIVQHCMYMNDQQSNQDQRQTNKSLQERKKENDCFMQKLHTQH